ncbi:MAG: trimethylamine methyltransferase family protein, partial [Pseudomonadota bacterium]
MNTEVSDRPARRRAGGRGGNQRRTSTVAINQSPWATVVNTDHPTTPLREDGVEAVHNAAMRLLEEIGIEFLNEEALAILKQAGCTVNGENVRMGRDFVM